MEKNCEKHYCLYVYYCYFKAMEDYSGIAVDRLIPVSRCGSHPALAGSGPGSSKKGNERAARRPEMKSLTEVIQ
jgi:hypothetical protein